MILQLTEVLANLTGISQSELEAQLKKNAKEDGTLDKSTVEEVLKTSFGAKFTEISDSQRKRGFREQAEKFEKEIETKFGVSGAKGIGLVELAINQVKPTPDQVITKENALKNPIVIEILQEQIGSVKDGLGKENEALRTEIANRDKEAQKAKIYSFAQNFYLQNKAKITKEGALDEGKWGLLKLAIDQHSYKLEGDTIVVLGEDGNQKIDTSFNKVSFEDHLKSINVLGFHEHDPNAGSAGARTVPPNGGNQKFNQIKSESDLTAYVNDRTNSKEDVRAAIDWFESKKNK